MAQHGLKPDSLTPCSLNHSALGLNSSSIPQAALLSPIRLLQSLLAPGMMS